MKTKPSLHKSFTILAGSVCALLSGAALTLAILPWEPAAWGKEPVGRAAAKTTKSIPSPKSDQSADGTPRAARSPEEATRLGLEYLLHEQQADGGWNQGG